MHTNRNIVQARKVNDAEARVTRGNWTRAVWGFLDGIFMNQGVPNKNPLQDSSDTFFTYLWLVRNDNSSYNCTPFLHSLLTKGKFIRSDIYIPAFTANCPRRIGPDTSEGQRKSLFGAVILAAH